MTKKHTYEHVYNYFKEHGCELLEKEYINSQTKMQYKCKCNNIAFIAFPNFKAGQRCMKCSGNEAKRHTYEYVYNYFKENDCELLEKEYINNNTPMKYKCSCDNISSIAFSNFKRGTRCSKCGGSEKHTYEYVYNYFKDNDCELLEKEYINNHTAMKYKCSCGDISTILFLNFKNGARCKECAVNKRRYDYEYVYNYFKDNDCELLEKEYINNKTLMEYKCSCGNISSISFGSFKNSNSRCMKCSGYEAQRFTYDYVYNYFKDNDCELLEKEYINAHTSLEYKCSCGNISLISFSNFKRGSKCRNCSLQRFIKTCIERFNTEHPMHNSEIAQKSSDNKTIYQTYDYESVSGKIFEKLQGYEKYFIDLNLYNDDNIINNRNDIPEIWYIDEHLSLKNGYFIETYRRYYPDFYINIENLIIEVKSDYTFYLNYEKNMLKKEACLKSGYNFEFFVFNKHGTLLSI